MRRLALPAGLSIVLGLSFAPGAGAEPVQVAAYETYVVGKGFDIKIVKLPSGQNVSLPASVNTSMDEVHPTLTSDGHYLLFMRTQLTPQLSGNIVPPAARSLVMVDLETGASATGRFQTADGQAGAEAPGAGPTFDPNATGTVFSGTSTVRGPFSAGIRQDPDDAGSMAVCMSGGPVLGDGNAFSYTCNPIDFPRPALSAFTDSNWTVDVPHAQRVAYGGSGNTFHSIRTRATTEFSAISGEYGATQIRSIEFKGGSQASTTSGPLTIGNNTIGLLPQTALRAQDTYFALSGRRGAAEGNQLRGSDPPDIFSAIFPDTGSQPNLPVYLDDAPSDVNTESKGEGMPTWSGSGLQLGFVRTDDGDSPSRKLLVYDVTPGIQAITAGPLNIGAAPTPQTRAYQEIWGNISLAEMDISGQGGSILFANSGGLSRYIGNKGFFSADDLLKFRRNQVTNPARGGEIKAKIDRGRRQSAKVALVIQRIVSRRTKRVLGLKLPRTREVGEVTLGTIGSTSKRGRSAARRKKKKKKGTPVYSFRWKGDVRSKRRARALGAGTYLFTLQLQDRRGRVLNTSKSEQIVIRGGRTAKRPKSINPF